MLHTPSNIVAITSIYIYLFIYFIYIYICVCVRVYNPYNFRSHSWLWCSNGCALVPHIRVAHQMLPSCPKADPPCHSLSRPPRSLEMPWGDHWDQHGSRHITANNQKVKLGQAWTRHPHAPLIWPRKMSFEETGRIWSPMRGSKYSADQLEVP